MSTLSILKNKVKNYLTDPMSKTLSGLLNVSIHPSQIMYHGYPHPLYFKNYNKYVPQFYKSYVATSIPLIIPIDYQPELTLFSNFRTYKLIKNIWEYDSEYYEIPEYKKMIEKIKNGNVIKIKKTTIQTISDLNTYFEKYGKLLKNMENNGYDESINQDDILVWIGPGGELVKDTKSGRHRIAAAKVVGLQEVPVKINHIHQKWLDSKLTAENITTEHLKKLLIERFH